MKTQEKITMKRNEKIKNELEKVRKENMKIEYTNQMYGLLNGEEMPNSRHPEDLNDLCYVINKNLKLINDGIKEKTTKKALYQITIRDSSFGPSTVPSGTNFKRARAPLNLVPDVTPTSMVPLTSPLMALSSDPAQGGPNVARAAVPRRGKLAPERDRSESKGLRVKKKKQVFVEDRRGYRRGSHTRTFNVLRSVGLHLIMMQIQVPRASIRFTVDPVEYFRVSGEPLCIPEDSVILFSQVLFYEDVVGHVPASLSVF
ncbi:hypothetical protein MTR67_003112 [Solanum verrucosum]|uniref:Uncharacterized protein n=1 Tax=Solanum verrucosum TaxID=315347 RepID=A0AAF0T6K9_SOLVR|nr:hypothetical protein MTR67_003112 [Solanum verrucosum]